MNENNLLTSYSNTVYFLKTLQTSSGFSKYCWIYNSKKIEWKFKEKDKTKKSQYYVYIWKRKKGYVQCCDKRSSMEIVKAFVKAFSFYFLENTPKKSHKQIVILYILVHFIYTFREQIWIIFCVFDTIWIFWWCDIFLCNKLLLIYC